MILNLGFLILFTLAFFGIGRRLLSLFGEEKLDLSEKIFFSLGLGIGFLEFLGWGFGLLGWLGRLGRLERWMWLGMLGVLGGLGILGVLGRIKRDWSNLINWSNWSDWADWKRWQRVLGILIFLRLLLNFFIAQAPVTEGDSLWHHLTTPKLFLKKGGIGDIYSLVSYNALNTEMLYLWALGLRNEILAQNLNFLVGGVFLTLAIFYFCRRFFSEKVGILAAFLFAFTPLVFWEGTTPLVDLFWTFFVFLAIWAFLEKKNLLGFTFFGFALGTKSILTLIPLTAAVFIFGGKNFFPGVILTFLLGSPSFWRSFFLTGNLVYPLFANFFGGGGLEVKKLVALQGVFYEKGLPFWDILTYWWRLTIFPRRFGPDIGPVYLAFGPVGLVFWQKIFPKKKLFLKLGLFCLGFYLLWYFFTFHSVRYLLPIFPFLVIFVAETIIYLIKIGGLLRLATLGILVFWIPMSFLTYLWSYEKYALKLKCVFGKASREEYLFQALPYTRDIFWMNKNLPSGAKVLLFFSGEMRPFYLERDFVLGSILQREIDFSRPEKIKNEEEFLNLIKKHGVTHIFAAPNLALEADLPLEKFRFRLGKMAGVKLIYQGIRGNVYQLL